MGPLPTLCHALLKRLGCMGLERVLWTDQPNDFVEAKYFAHSRAYLPMAFMSRVKTASKQTDRHVVSEWREWHGLFRPRLTDAADGIFEGR